MQAVLIIVGGLLICSIPAVAQDPGFTFKTATSSAFIWGADSPGGATSSLIHDPLTEKPIRKLSYSGIEVSSRMGFERVGGGHVGEFLGYTTTVVNNTTSPISVGYGGISVDGKTAAPLSARSSKHHTNSTGVKKRDDTIAIQELHCFAAGYLSDANLFSANSASERFVVNPGNAMTVSSVIKDPRNYGVRCSIAGCYPKGTIRYFLTIDSHDYVFVWPGQSVVNCGK